MEVQRQRDGDVRVTLRPGSMGDAVKLIEFLARIESELCPIRSVHLRKWPSMGKRVRLTFFYEASRTDAHAAEKLRAYLEPMIEDFWDAERA